MVPKITSWKDFSKIWESSEKDKFLHCGFEIYDENDVAYLGKIQVRRLNILPEQFEAALQVIADDEIYPEPPHQNLTLASENPGMDVFIKRPSLIDYDFYKGEDGSGLSQLRFLLLDEVLALETISKERHPNIVQYYGCRMKRGRITGINLEKVPGHNLRNLLERNLGSIQMEPFMDALTKTVNFLHSIGLSHNDICPQNVMVRNGRPVLVDFGSCRRTGERMGASGGSIGWKEEGDDYLTSKNSHDIYGLKKISRWIAEKQQQK
jgi:serine/threonine protein kinase